MSARGLMVMGTASDVGKSVVVAALCRVFANAGVRVAPFKAQNMSNNAAVCAGGEIGRAQAVQAEACRLEPNVDMNPVLLKPESDTGCQVVIRGRAEFQMTTRDYDHYRGRAWPEIVASYARLAREFELVVIEGAGGAAEVNLRDRDIVNWPIAELADAPVIIVADIDKGGVLASLVGTIALLSQKERARVKGMIINKFRGDKTLLYDAVRIIEERTGAPILGILPYAGDLEIPEEDGASLRIVNARARALEDRDIAIGVVVFPRIANYTDFEPLMREPDVVLRYVESPERAGVLDVLCLPGTKSTIADLKWMRDRGWDRYVAAHRKNGGAVVGICGGYQMLGRRIDDPQHVESETATIDGLGLLEIATRFEGEKITIRTDALHAASGLPISGYEIHCGRIERFGASPLFTRAGADARREDSAENIAVEGAISGDGQVIGTSIHGVFDTARFRRHFLNQIRARKGLGPLNPEQADAREIRDRAYDRFAQILRSNLDVAAIAAIAGIEPRRLRD